MRSRSLKTEGFFGSRRKRLCGRRIRAGFTLVEVCVVLVIMAIVASIAIPSMTGYIDRGRQISRTNIARTIYLAMQNQLTKSTLEKTLKSTLTGDYYDSNAANGLNTLLYNSNNVYVRLGDTYFPGNDEQNKEYIYFISKPKGYVPGTNDIIDRFYNLLDGIILDKTILNDAVLMEYNIKTGVVMSIFYGDILGEGEWFDYDGDGDSADIKGLRGMGTDGYAGAEDRRQGYYGVDFTGSLPDIAMEELVNIYDGKTKPLEVSDFTAVGGETAEKTNVLYVELMLPKANYSDVKGYTLEIIEADDGIDDTVEETIIEFEISGQNIVPSGFAGALSYLSSYAGEQFFYKDDIEPAVYQYGIDVGTYYDRYIWVLDYVYGDMFADEQYGIDRHKDAEGSPLITLPLDVQARVTWTKDAADAQKTSETAANTHYYRAVRNVFGLVGEYEINSARHLNNIRYAPTEDFRQIEEIDMRLAGNSVDNFKPIESLGGTYNAKKSTDSQFRILNLTINAGAEVGNAALFGEVSGTVTGVSLFEAQIIAPTSGNAGAIAGTLSGKITQSNSYASVTGGANTGGLTGQILSGGILEQSFNAGFFDANDTPDTLDGIGSVTSATGNVGGLAGVNNGVIKNCFNNARVNVARVTVVNTFSTEPLAASSVALSIGGIAGNNGGTVENCYATNFVADGSGTNIGGIAGTGGGSQTNCSFLSNGSSGAGIVSKDDLRDRLTGLNSAYTSGTAYEEGNNLYSRYPYPTLKNNAPFNEGYRWGWEDIEPTEIGDSDFFYYEMYQGTPYTWGYSSSSERTSSGLVAPGSSAIVASEGYGIELAFSPAGYTIVIGGTAYTVEITGTEASPVWTIRQGSSTQSWPAPRKFTSTDDYGVTTTKYRLFIPNSVLEARAAANNAADAIVFQVFSGRTADTENDNPIVEERFNPLFADTVGKTGHNFAVRSPRHLDNIDRDATTLASYYIQQLNIDFNVYRKEINVNAQGSVAPAGNKLSFANSPNPYVVAGTLTGTYNGSSLYLSNVERPKSVFETIGADAVVRGVVLRNSNIGEHNSSGGISITNNGMIDSCSVLSVTLTGSSSTGSGLVTAVNNGTISNTTVTDSTANVNGNNAGAIAGINNKTIDGCTVSNFTFIKCSNYAGGVAGDSRSESEIKNTVVEGFTTANTSYDYIGGVAGRSAGVIESCTVISANISKTSKFVAGIAGASSGSVSGCSVEKSFIYGLFDDIGGIVGTNSGAVSTSGVLHSEVKSSGGNNVGGIVGNNSAGNSRVADVFFLSVYDIGNIPVSVGANNTGVGGIVGSNSGSVARVLYLAPAPQRVSGGITTIYPIVGRGTDAAKTDDGLFDTCYYLTGFRYSINQGINWTTANYNRVFSDDAETVDLSGGGMGLITSFVDLDWINYAYAAGFSNWYQPTSGYPYPILRGTTASSTWPMADSPVRPDQLDTDEWETTLSTSNRAQTLSFLNGDFELPLMNPNNSSETHNILRIDSITTAPTSTASDSANLSRGGFVYDLGSPASPPSVNGGNYYGMFIYYNSTWVQGWNTRPVDSTTTNEYANMIEFQRPYSSSLSNSGRYGRVRTNYEGTQTGAYIELNADVPGTLYQICATVPGTELYYSFYHARRNSGNETGGNQRMNFYLSGMTDNNGTWTYSNGTGRPTIIRPCITPRGTSLSQATTRNTVVYGTTGTAADEPVTVGKVDFYDPKTGGTRNAYLIDVWVSGLGYGITFWTDTLPNSTPIGDNNVNRIPTAGVINITTAKTTNNGAYLPSALISAARDNVIGYWHVKEFSSGQYSEWKQYYGLYTIPEGQRTTEFAYESASRRNEKEGNYLDGITFQSPGFLSIEKYIRLNGVDVSFVKPGDGEPDEQGDYENDLIVTLAVKNWGEVPVDNIVLTDRISPFDAYIDFLLGGTVSVIKGGSTISGTTASVQQDSSGNRVLVITLPENMTLALNEEMTVTFRIGVKKEVTSGVSTLLYYFRNQGCVSYYDTGYAGYSKANTSIDQKKKNASNIRQVFIDPIKLSETVTPIINGPFEITLTVRNTQEIKTISTSGMITDNIPKGFTVDESRLPENAVITQNPDGSTRLTIRAVNLTPTESEQTYKYYISYTGPGYGVSYTSVSADYKYLYSDSVETMNVMLNFPHVVVGISASTTEDSYIYSGSGTDLYDIQSNDKSQRMADDNYDVSPVIALFNEQGNAATENTDGNFQIDHEYYTATLVRSTGQLRFTPKAGANGVYEFYYQVQLTVKKPQGTLNNTNLSSAVTKISVEVIGDTVVYYEKYLDGSYGFFAGDSVHVPAALNDSLSIVESGYGVISRLPGKSIRLGTGAATADIESLASYSLYRLGAAETDDLVLQTVYSGDTALGKIHPNFAKAVYAASAANAGNAFEIRTARQMRGIGMLNATAGLTFTQTRNLDFTGIDLNFAGAVVAGEFKGTFNGNGLTIGNLIINSPELSYVGLFSKNSGTIKNITLSGGKDKPVVIIGSNFVGGITGWNAKDGRIISCTVEGTEDPVNPGTYLGMHIEAIGGTDLGGNPVNGENAGGIAGWNDGAIEGCTVHNSTESIVGANYIGGIAGVNGDTGTITGASLSNLRIEAKSGENVGQLTGADLNITVPAKWEDVETVEVIKPAPEPEPTDEMTPEPSNEPEVPPSPTEETSPTTDATETADAEDLDETAKPAGNGPLNTTPDAIMPVAPKEREERGEYGS